MPTFVLYNNIRLENVLTRQFEQESVMDESGTDLLFYRYRMTFDGIIQAEPGNREDHPAYVDSYDTTVERSASALFNIAKKRLGVPRARLIVYIREPETSASAGGDKTLIDTWPATVVNSVTANRDVDNGPKPKLLAITQVCGGRALRVKWSVECALTPCDNMPIVLNNRWSVREELGDTFFLTRTIAGTLRLAVTTAQLGADYRWLVVPALEPGFRRSRMEFEVDKTGLQVNYNIMDTQIHTAAPWPAAKMSVTHEESTNDGVSFFSAVRVRLEGYPDSPKRLLMTRALQIIDARLRFTERRAGSDYTIEEARIVDHIGDENAVDASMRIRSHTKEPREWLANLRQDILGTPLELPKIESTKSSGVDVLPEYDPDVSMTPNVYGYTPDGRENRVAVLALMQCYLQNPCTDIHGIAKVELERQDEGEPEDRKSTKIYEAEEGAIPESPGDEFNEDAKTAIYTHATMENRYTCSMTRVQLPIAKAVSQSPGDSGNGETDASKDTCSVFTLSRGVAQRHLSLDAERVGEWPEIVEPVDTYKDGEIKGTLLDYSIEPHPPALSADGSQRIYRVSARYRYALNRPIDKEKDETIGTGALPFAKYKPSDEEARLKIRTAYADLLGIEP